MNQKNSKKWIVKETVYCFFLFGLLVILNSANFLLNKFGDVTFATVLYQLSSPLVGTGKEVLLDYLWNGVGKSFIETLSFFCIYVFLYILRSTLKFCIIIKLCNQKKDIDLLKEIKEVSPLIHISVISVLLLVLIIKLIEIGIPTYIQSVANTSTLYEEYYIEPDEVELIFPEKKRNLIYIYLESMESTYASIDDGGGKPYNYIPNLTEIANNNISFSESDFFGGYTSYDGWTMGALLSSTTGATYKLPIEGNSAGQYQDFLPGITSMGDVLEREGYSNYFMCGSDAKFGGRELYFSEHGNYKIYDYYTGIEEGIIPEDYYYFWGFEDQVLYPYAKDKLGEIAEKDKPFNFTLLTVDTHHPEGCICDLCKNEYSEQFANTISCADRQISDFLKWIQEQEWYENTTIVIVGDHLSMNTTFWDDIPENYERKVYNCFINAAINGDEVKTKKRKIYSMDLFPTTLSALGVTIHGERLGLGTNAFSNVPTLAEIIGEQKYNAELSRYSAYYTEHFIKNK